MNESIELKPGRLRLASLDVELKPDQIFYLQIESDQEIKVYLLDEENANRFRQHPDPEAIDEILGSWMGRNICFMTKDLRGELGVLVMNLSDKTAHIQRKAKTGFLFLEFPAEEPEPEPRRLTYCSFSGGYVSILEGEYAAVPAADETHLRGINPGGTIMASPCSEKDPHVPKALFETMWQNRHRLLSGDEARELFGAKTIEEWRNEERKRSN